VLAKISEPVKGYARHSQGKAYSSLSPLTRFVDTCYPESFEARNFKELAGRFVASRDSRQAEELKSWLQLWVENHQKIIDLAETSPALKEIIPLSESLKNVSLTGLEAVNLIIAGQAADSAWLQTKFQLLEEARKPVAECLLVILPGVKLILDSLKK
jgi:hypothetical protein